MLKNKPSIALFTNGFPFGFSEKSFLGPELEFLHDNFETDAIFTQRISGPMQKGHFFKSVYYYTENKRTKADWGIAIRFLVIMFPLWFPRFLVLCIRHRTSLKDFCMQLSQFKKYYWMVTFIHAKMKKQPVDIFYTYWLDHWNVAASIYKRLVNRKLTIVSRAHRFEIDEGNSSLGFFPFRNLQLQNTNITSLISQKWAEQFINSHPKFSKKITCNPLGVPSKDFIMTPNHNKRYHILSISKIIDVKNMELQAAALAKLNIPVDWHHFGADKEDMTLANIVEGSKVKYRNYGFVDPGVLNSFLTRQYIHFLLNTSRVEGVPVSMMECIAHGVPIIALDVGGNAEIVNRSTGIILDQHIEAGEFSERIEEALTNYHFNRAKRDKIREFQVDKFSAATNHSRFHKMILAEFNRSRAS